MFSGSGRYPGMLKRWWAFCCLGAWGLRWMACVSGDVASHKPTYCGWLRNPNHQLVDGQNPMNLSHYFLLGFIVSNSYQLVIGISWPSTLNRYESLWTFTIFGKSSNSLNGLMFHSKHLVSPQDGRCTGFLKTWCSQLPRASMVDPRDPGDMRFWWFLCTLW